MVTEVYTGERKWEELRERGRHRRESVCTELRPLIRGREARERRRGGEEGGASSRQRGRLRERL